MIGQFSIKRKILGILRILKISHLQMYHDNFEFQSAGTSITKKGFQIDQSENVK